MIPEEEGRRFLEEHCSDLLQRTCLRGYGSEAGVYLGGPAPTDQISGVRGQSLYTYGINKRRTG